MSVPINLNQALEILGKLQDAAPKVTREKLGQVAGLLRSLADENTYLNTLLVDNPMTRTRLGEREPVSLRKTQTGAVPVVSVAGLQRRMNRETGETVPVRPEADLSVQRAGGGDLLSGMNDTLRPPLIAIRGRAELVQAGFLGHITPEQDQWLESIQENTGRAFALLDTIQQVMTLQDGKVRLDAVNFLATDLMTEAWNRLRDKANAVQHQISVEVPPTVPLARGDFYHALIILADLLENAILYTPPGGNIRLLADNLSTHVLFSVIDNGIGLTAEDQARVSQAFWRGDHHKLVRQHPGTGLRLYLARELLKRMGGELIYSGQSGQGSTFSFTLPVA